MKRSLQSVFTYFDQFGYAPTLQEIYIFYPHPLEFDTLYALVQEAVARKELQALRRTNEYDFPFYPDTSLFRYTRGEYKKTQKTAVLHKSKVAGSLMTTRMVSERNRQTSEKLRGASVALRLLQWIPQIFLVGLSGSCAMRNAQQTDDIDVFIITKPRRLWTARFIGLICMFIIGRKRRKGRTSDRNRICMNLFFDASNQAIPVEKQTLYVAHEVLQMKPIYDRGGVYEQFLRANAWVFDLFPNARAFLTASPKKISVEDQVWIVRPVSHIISVLFDCIERGLGYLQRGRIARTRTNERITATQLWFFPDDFEKKIR